MFIDFLPFRLLFSFRVFSSLPFRPTSLPPHISSQLFRFTLLLSHLLLFSLSLSTLLFLSLAYRKLQQKTNSLLNSRDNEYKEHHKKWFIVTDGSEQQESNKYTQSMTTAVTQRSSGTIRFLILIVA